MIFGRGAEKVSPLLCLIATRADELPVIKDSEASWIRIPFGSSTLTGSSRDKV